MEWSYVAGFFDAEGSIAFYDRKIRSPVVIQIVNTNKAVIEKIKNFINVGYVYEKRYKENSKHFGKKIVYSFNAYTIKDVKRILENILPFSIVKREKVIAGLKILNSNADLNKLPEMNWGYIAGFFDGDGCITFSGNRWIVSLRNINRDVLEKIRDFMGFGNLYFSNISSLTVSMRDVPKFIENVLPFSIVKKDLLLKVKEELKTKKWHPNYKLQDFSKEELKETLEKMYHDEKLSIRKIAKKMGVTYNTIYEYFAEFKIPLRTLSEAGKLVPPRKHTEEAKKKISEARKKNWQNLEYRKRMLKILEKAREKI